MTEVSIKLSEAYLVRESSRMRYDQPPRVDDSRLILGDAQVPYHDAEFINLCKAVAFAWGIRKALWVGDMVDFSSLSVFLHQDDGSLEHELDDNERYLKDIQAGFEEIMWVRGNHEDRLFRMLNAVIGMERMAKLLGLDTGTIQTTNYYWCEIGNDWLAEHPKNTNVIPARVGTFLSEKFSKNVITFHGHTTGQAQDRSGRRLAIDAGICADPLRLEYHCIRHNTRPAMTQGAVILRKDANGNFYPYHLTRFSDWDSLIKMGALWELAEKLQS